MHALPRIALALALGALANFAIGQQYPAKPVRLVLGFSAGGGTDLQARLIGQKLSEYWGHQVVVENRVGAGGTIGAEFVAKSAPDGYTILLGSVNQNAIAPAVFSKLGYNASRDFAPIVYVSYSSLVLNVHPSLPVKSVKELTALTRARPGEITAASAGGNGTTHHLAIEMYMTATGAKIIHVPYKGSGQSFTDLISGQVLMAFDVLPPSIGYIKQGRLRALAVTTLKRSAKMPELPTMDEAGVKGFEIINWYAFYAPAKTPPEIVAKINADINKALQDPTVIRRLDEAGLEIGGGTPESLDSYNKAEIAKFDKLVKAAGIKLE
jgi:tripartite-type tricarboxylate transporter receptor subunit TctC